MCKLCLFHFPSSTGAYTACTYILQLALSGGGGDGIYAFVVGACGNAGCMHMAAGNLNKACLRQAFLLQRIRSQ